MEHAFPSLGTGLAHSALNIAQIGTPPRFFRVGPPPIAVGKHPKVAVGKDDSTNSSSVESV
jgi:hypothetical protein